MTRPITLIGIFILMTMVNVCVVQCCSKYRTRKRRGGVRNGCFHDRTMVWTKNETESDQSARQIVVKEIKEGNLVGTTEIDMNLNNVLDFSWTRATDVTHLNGAWKAHSFTFASGHHLTVTSPHLMIIWKYDAPYFVRADQVQVGDEMKVGFRITKVNKIENHIIYAKVAVETEEGTLEVNGVLASGLCDNNPEVMKRIVKVKPMIKKYKASHFGEEYGVMCMNSDSWMNAYLINNGMSIQI